MKSKNKEMIILIAGVVFMLVIFEAYKIYCHVKKVNGESELLKKIRQATAANPGNE